MKFRSHLFRQPFDFIDDLTSDNKFTGKNNARCLFCDKWDFFIF